MQFRIADSAGTGKTIVALHRAVHLARQHPEARVLPTTLEAYRNVLRLGRKTRLPEKHRALLWAIFEKVRERLLAQDLITTPELFARLAIKLSGSKHSVLG